MAALRTGRDLTPEQKATHEKYARSRTWRDIVAGRYQGAAMDGVAESIRREDGGEER